MNLGAANGSDDNSAAASRPVSKYFDILQGTTKSVMLIFFFFFFGGPKKIADANCPLDRRGRGPGKGYSGAPRRRMEIPSGGATLAGNPS
jgi:hypothetical protein